ncbi:MAG: universal stress protein [Bacteroidetes bacterium]|nr:universal stress protein [Bacteroidota bacterium]
MKSKKIIVGIDFTKSSENALKYAITLAKHSNSELLLFHLYGSPVALTNSGLYYMNYDNSKPETDKKLQKFAEKIIKSDTSILFKISSSSGLFKTEIEKLIKKNNVHSVVLGLGSKSKINRFIYGSHVTDIAGKINCPVIIVPESYKIHSLGLTLIASDNMQQINNKCIGQIKDFINSTQSKIKVVHLKTPNELIQNKPERLVFGDIKVPLITKKSINIVEGITKSVRQFKANTVLCIYRRHSFIYRFFNDSTTKEIAFSSKVPVVIIHE